MVDVKDALAKKKFPGAVYRISSADCGQVYADEIGNFAEGLKQQCYDVKK